MIMIFDEQVNKYFKPFFFIGGKFKFKDSIRERYVAAADEPESALLASQKEEKYAELKHSRSDTNVETKDEKTTYPPVGIDWPKEMKKVSCMEGKSVKKQMVATIY